ncbi:MAG: S-adenosylmethionine decarboxylase proenzyme [Elusimicrobia bacterium RIFOXYB2_FULL_62_6]|nr:MAG: S-adenosylmethionine decarboxylase proenzyme [Elusimicrobia bacterium RIFOXYB2_FULL_62_6]
MRTLGRHLIAELYGCDKKSLSAVDKVQGVMIAAAKAANATVIDSVFHRFSPWGVSGVVVIEESHFAIHTWPEHGYASVDLFTCGAGTRPWAAFERLKKDFKAAYFSVIKLERGLMSKQALPGGLPCRLKIPVTRAGWTKGNLPPKGGWSVGLCAPPKRRSAPGGRSK